MPSAVMSISGNVAYDDGSHSPFEATVDERGLLANPFAASSLESFASVERDDPTVIDDLIALLIPPPVLTPDPADGKSGAAVTDVVMVIRGQVALDDQTKESFVIEYNNGDIDHFPTETSSVWTELRSSFSSELTSMLEVVAGEGSVVIP